MLSKTSIRYFNNKPVRAKWDNKTTSWWYVAVDLISTFTDSQNPRIYWNSLKKRNKQLSKICRQLKITAKDNKKYNTDCLDEHGVKELIYLLPNKKQKVVSDWFSGYLDPIDEQSKRKAYELYENAVINEIEIGTIKGLKQIHAYIFGGLYDFAGKTRKRNISKKGYLFANWEYFNEIFKEIELMPDNTLSEIVDKYINLNIVHPFLEGNGRSMRIWLDLLLRDRLKKCVDWQKIDKKDYLKAMEKSPNDPSIIRKLISKALTEKINDREIFLKGIDYSYYYEQEE